MLIQILVQCFLFLSRLGFHTNPLLSLRAKPKLGERNVRLTHVTEWIEYKLKQEFKVM
jgi:hypothetical protein